VEQRARIWRAVWPARAALDPDLDFDTLARVHPLSGGHIRNIALAASHLARSRDVAVDNACLARAIEREYAKLGLVTEALAQVGA